MQSFFRKARKLRRLLAVSEFRRGLLKGVGASIEHIDIIRRENFTTLLDIGANRGQFSLLVTGLRPETRVFAFEPQSSAAAVYQSLFAGRPLVRLFRAAVGAVQAQAEIRVAEKNDSSSLLEFSMIATTFGQGEAVGLEAVTVAPLDAFVSAEQILQPCFCKIDVQGYEMEVIKGCANFIDFIDYFYIECSSVELYKGQPKVEDIIHEMQQHGFRVKRIGHVSGNPSEPGVIFDVLFARDRVT